MKERKLGILGRKVGMTTYFTEEREAVGVSVIELGPCPVLAKRTTETNDQGQDRWLHRSSAWFRHQA